MKLESDISIEEITVTEREIRFIANVVKQNGRKILANYPITSPQFIALQNIIEDENITIGNLSKKIGLAFSTTTDIVNRMEKNELVERIRDTFDRRVIRIRALEKGKVIIDEVIKKRQVYLGEILKGFKAEEVTLLNNMLRRLHNEMKEHD